MSGPGDGEQVTDGTSPFLGLYAGHPVDWFRWGDNAFEEAETRDRPIFLSLGFHSSHWCHDLVSTVFAHDSVATLLEEQFVPVAVDCTERPDIDLVFQTLSRQELGYAGWPLSVWLTPAGRPFRLEVTPADAHPDSFADSLESVGESWNAGEGRAALETRARKLIAQAIEALTLVSDPQQTPEQELLIDAAKGLVRTADPEHGGWGVERKFPHPGRIRLLLRAFYQTGRPVYRDVAVEALDAMADGGLYDHVGGGFHRYTTDRAWRQPSFEKMLYTNASVSAVYLQAYQLTETDRYAAVVRETLSFLERELAHENGGFCSGLGSASETDIGELAEGAFYCWTPEQVHTAISGNPNEPSSWVSSVDQRDAEVFCERYGIDESSAFDAGTVLRRTVSPTQIASNRDLTETQVERALEHAHERVFAARERRRRPPRDETVLAGWNGLALSAFATAALVLDERYIEPARETLTFVRDVFWDESTNTLSRRFHEGGVGIDGFLSDYAFLGRGVLDCYRVTGECDHLAFALALARAVEETFWDEESATLSFTPGQDETFWPRLRDDRDGPRPASAAVAIELLDALSWADPTGTFESLVSSAVANRRRRVRAAPGYHSWLLAAIDATQTPRGERLLVTEQSPDALRHSLTEVLVENRSLVWRPTDETQLGQWCDALDLAEPPHEWERPID